MARVEWTEEALNELAAIWTAAESTDRAAITAAANAVDAQLQRDPLHAGESRVRDERILFEAPLGVTFSVQNDSSSALVLHVWQFQ